jgi:hypothetical protein
MKTIQEMNSGAHAGAELPVLKHICQLDDLCTESELDFLATVMQSDFALEFTPPRLELYSVKVQAGRCA